MRTVRTSPVVSRSLLLGLAALVWSGCGGGPEGTDTGSSSELQVQYAALAPDQCAPVPAAQTSAGGIVYHRYSSGKTWASARADCAAMGGRLTVPFNAASNATVLSIIGTDLTYIGLKQATGQATPSTGWQTPEGFAASYFNWSSGEPNDTDNAVNDFVEDDAQDCARMSTTGSWDDVECSQVSPYVCEFSAPPRQCAGGSSCAPGTDSNYHCFCPTGQHYDAAHNACARGS